MLDLVMAEALVTAYIFLLVFVIIYFLIKKNKKTDGKGKEERTDELVQKLIKESNTGDLSEIRSQRLEWESMVKDRLLSVDPGAGLTILRIYKYFVRTELRKEIHDDLIRASADGSALSEGKITLKRVASWVVKGKF